MWKERKHARGQSQDRNVSISLIGHESLELVPVLVFSFKSLDPKDSIEFSFSEKIPLVQSLLDRNKE